MGLKVPDAALADTTRWLQKPESWEHNGGEGPFSDKRLARVAFTAALATAVSTGRVSEREAVVKAARALALDQAADGSWPLEGEDATSAPATYGRPLATLLARAEPRHRGCRGLPPGDRSCRRLAPETESRVT